MREITYYGYATNPRGKFEQMLIRRSAAGKSADWTGVVYRSEREALADVARLNSASAA
jgi:hypothetical protein